MIPGPDKLALSIATPSGLFTGSFIDPVSRRRTKLQGVLFPDETTAAGYFLTPTHSGNITLTAP
jgi:hypothetical protein